jgi:lysine 2,3-aminomutase
LLISAWAHAFRKRFFPAARAHDWNDWRWQLRHRIRDLPTLARILRLSDDERTAIARHRGALPVGITPYYASLLDSEDPQQPLRYSVVPVNGEYGRTPGEN